MFLPLTLRQRTHRNAIQLSRSCRKYSALTHMCQAGILLAWRRKQSIRLCGLLRQIWKLLPAFGNCMDVSLIQRLFDWLCKLWLGRSRPLSHQLPQGRAIPPRLKRAGLSCPFSVNRLPERQKKRSYEIREEALSKYLTREALLLS